MGSSAQSSSTTIGSIEYSAQGGDAAIGLLSAVNGTVAVNSSGQIIDINDGAVAVTNFVANNLVLTAASGIGDSNELETQISFMDIINTGANNIRLDQNGSVEITRLHNANSNGTIQIDSNGTFTIHQGSILAKRDTGRVEMITTNGDFLGLDDGTTNAHITAKTGSFIASGTFGTQANPIIVDMPAAPDGIVEITATTISVSFVPEKPEATLTGLDISALSVVSAVAGEQLIEIESLGDIDPAIFTALRSYSQEDVAIRMPRDQRYEDELEEDEEGQI